MYRFFVRREFDKSYDLAHALLLRPELPRTIRATCCTFLGTSCNVDYLAYAAEAVELWEMICQSAEDCHRIIGEDPPKPLTDMLAAARRYLKTAQSDDMVASESILWT